MDEMLDPEMAKAASDARGRPEAEPVNSYRRNDSMRMECDRCFRFVGTSNLFRNDGDPKNGRLTVPLG